MKKLNYGTVLFSTFIIIIAVLGGLILLSALGVKFEQTRVQAIEAKTAQMRVQIDADNAQHWRAKDWFYTIGSAVLLSFFIVRYELISRRQNEKINVVINWVGRRKGK